MKKHILNLKFQKLKQLRLMEIQRIHYLAELSDPDMAQKLKGVAVNLLKYEDRQDALIEGLLSQRKPMTRNTPSFMTETVIELPEQDRGIEKGIVRMNPSRLDHKRIDKKAFYRRQAVRILNPENGQFIIRMPMGGGGLPGLTKDTIALDYDAVDALGLSGKFRHKPLEVELEVSKADIISIYRYFWNHPDIAYRAALRLGLLGLALGIMGLIPSL